MNYLGKVIKSTVLRLEGGYKLLNKLNNKKEKKISNERNGHIVCYNCDFANPIKDLSKNLCIKCNLSLPFIY